MEKTDKKPVEKTAPKWGTKEWIAAYPWSRMDRKRRRRVIAALPKERGDLLAQDAGKVPFLHACMANTLFESKKTIERVCKLLDTIDASAVKVLDAVVAAWLTEAWGLWTGADKGKKAK